MIRLNYFTEILQFEKRICIAHHSIGYNSWFFKLWYNFISQSVTELSYRLSGCIYRPLQLCFGFTETYPHLSFLKQIGSCSLLRRISVRFFSKSTHNSCNEILYNKGCFSTFPRGMSSLLHLSHTTGYAGHSVS